MIIFVPFTGHDSDIKTVKCQMAATKLRIRELKVYANNNRCTDF
jgi:hypothetical protein